MTTHRTLLTRIETVGTLVTTRALTYVLELTFYFPSCVACLPAADNFQPVMRETCCPQYTIRLDVTRFKQTKGQRQVLNRLNRYLDGEKDSGSTNTTASVHRDSSGRNSSSAAGGINSNSNGRNNKPYQARGALRGKQASAHGDSAHGDAQRQNSEMLGALSERVAAAAVCTLEGGVVSGLDLGAEWRSDIADWSRVRGLCVVRSAVVVVMRFGDAQE